MRVKIGGMCWTITIGTGKASEICGKPSASALGPPVEVPIATISMREFALTRAITAGGHAGIGTSFKGAFRPHKALILGISSARMRSLATPELPVWLGL